MERFVYVFIDAHNMSFIILNTGWEKIFYQWYIPREIYI